MEDGHMSASIPKASFVLLSALRERGFLRFEPHENCPHPGNGAGCCFRFWEFWSLGGEEALSETPRLHGAKARPFGGTGVSRVVEKLLLSPRTTVFALRAMVDKSVRGYKHLRALRASV